ncbi:hypothetical protein OWV82_021898 [Melia azedarach]|uniref:Uncharacterized protein n=1 Tax=Melia azedarach TaxID=155640 RepID=A0ACC1X2E4_MELAZ|nr:hypothetical protein OWV82_021898 [Melia azedarach]
MRSVHSYAIKFEDFYGHSLFYDSQECLVERFLEGLQADIRDRMPSYNIHTLPYAILLAKGIEEQLKLDFDRVIGDVVDNVANKISDNMAKIDHKIMTEDVPEKKIDDVPKIIQEENCFWHHLLDRDHTTHVHSISSWERRVILKAS